MRRADLTALSLMLTLTFSACGSDGDAAPSGPPAVEDLGEGDAAELKGDSFGVSTATPPGTTVPLLIDNGSFPPPLGTEPNVLVYVPKGFDPRGDVGVVVYLHGWNNCVTNIVRPKNGVCRPGKAPHNAYNLANQLEASGKNALLVAPELMFEAASSEPGRLADEGVFAALLEETLARASEEVDQLGGLGVWAVSSIVVASHSGGYHAAAGIVARGGLWVDEVLLLDSYYGEEEAFDGFFHEDLDAITAGTRRFASVYSKTGGTLQNTQAAARRAAEWLPAEAVLDDRSGATLNDTQLATGALFKASGLSHEDVPRYYFSRLLATSGLPAIPLAEPAPE